MRLKAVARKDLIRAYFLLGTVGGFVGYLRNLQFCPSVVLRIGPQGHVEDECIHLWKALRHSLYPCLVFSCLKIATNESLQMMGTEKPIPESLQDMVGLVVTHASHHQLICTVHLQLLQLAQRETALGLLRPVSPVERLRPLCK